MKRFIILLCVSLLTLGFLSSCEDVKPEFKFQLELSGNVSDSPTAIKGDFTINVTNEVVQNFNDAYILGASKDVISITEPQGVQANEWLDKYIQENVINEFHDTTEYYIAVKGYVHETLTGITFSVDKVFTNRKI